jgi:hypothetical protein
MASGEKGHKKDGREAMAKDAALIESEKIDELPAPKPDTLIDKAEQVIRQRQAETFRQNEIEQSRKERLTVVLMSAMEMAEDEAREADLAALEKALNAAQSGGVLPHLRVKARKLLMEKRRKRDLAANAENVLRKTLEEASKIVASGESNERFVERLKEQIAIASRHGLKKSIIEQAQLVLSDNENQKRKRQLTEQGLKELITSNDKERIEDALFLYARDFLEQDEGARRIVAQLEVRRAQLEQREARTKELNTQIEAAKKEEDLQALCKLYDEAKKEGIKVSPSAIRTMHSLQAVAASMASKTASQELDEEPSSLSLPSVRPKSEGSAAAQVTRKIYCEKKQADVNQAVIKAEDDPHPKNVDFARKAVVDAKLERLVPENEIRQLERRLAILERTDGIRLQAESELSRCLSVFEKLFEDKVSAPMHDGNVIALQTSVDAAVAAGAAPDLLKRGHDLLDKWQSCSKDQRKIRELLRDALQRTGDTSADIHLLATAIKCCEENGINAAHAERKLAQWESMMERRISAEHELAEASDESGLASGALGRQRLEHAIRAAEAAGVGVRKINEAHDRLARLTRHEKRCSAMAGNIQRLLPSLQEEPWRFLELMEATKRLKPWTAQLEKQVKASMDQMEKNRDLEERQKEVEEELKVVLMVHSRDLDKLQDVRSDKEPKLRGADQDTSRLEKAIESAQKLRVKSQILDEAVACLKTVNKERSKLNVAEHRLRLAVNGKDLPEIERSTREIRALGRNVSQPEGSQSARRPKGGPPNSARLMEMATTVAKQLDDAATRKQAAESELWRWIADEQPPSIHDSDGKSVPVDQSKAWVSEVLDIVHEGKQTGVSATLIEHAKLKIHQRLRAEKERREACQVLAKHVNGKEVSTQDLLRGIHKVRRRNEEVPSSS